MSAWPGVAAAGVALALAIVAAGQPLWEWHLVDPAQDELWSYGPLDATHRLTNRTTNVTVVTRVAYADLAAQGQPRMAALFQEIGAWYLLGLLGTLAGAALAGLAAAKRLRGLYAAVAMGVGTLPLLYASLSMLLTVPVAAADLPTLNGQPILDFRGAYTLQGANTILSWGPLAGWVLLLAWGIVLAWGSSDIRVVRLSKKRAVAPAPKPSAQPTSAPLPPPPVSIVEQGIDEPDLDEVFVIAPSGLLVKHMSRTLMSDKDRDVVGGMIAVVSNFVKEAFTEKDGEVQEVTLGQHRFVMVSDQGVVLAVLVRTGSTEDVVHRLRHLMALLFDRYGDRLTRWDGTPLEGVEDELVVLWEPFYVPPPPAA